MAVGFDAQSFKDLTSTGGTWTHTPVGTPRGVGVLFAGQGSTSDVVLGVSFGGATLTRLAFATIGSSVNPGNVYAYYKGTAVATSGTVNVVLSAATVSNHYTAWAFTVTANQAWTQSAGTATINAGTLVNPSATVHAVAGDSGLLFGVAFSGQDAPASIVPNTGYTAFTGSASFGRDFGTQSAVAEWSTQYTAGATVSVGWADAVGDSVAAIGMFIREVVPTPPPDVVSAVQRP